MKARIIGIAALASLGFAAPGKAVEKPLMVTESAFFISVSELENSAVKSIKSDASFHPLLVSQEQGTNEAFDPNLLGAQQPQDQPLNPAIIGEKPLVIAAIYPMGSTTSAGAIAPNYTSFNDLETGNQIRSIILDPRQSQGLLGADFENSGPTILVKDLMEEPLRGEGDAIASPPNTIVAQSIAEPTAPQQNPTPTQQSQIQIQQLQERLGALEQVPLQQIYLGAPGTSSNTPTAYGGSWGSVGVGLSFQQRTRFTDRSDGTSGLVFSFGDPQDAVGLDIGVTALDLSDFGDRGSFNFKLHRRLPDDFAVAIGLENALIWGFSDADTSLYGVVSKRFRLRESSREPFSRLNVSLGLGNGRFRSEENVNEDEGSIGVFGSVAVNVAEPVSVFAEWTGQDLNMGASIVPFRNLPLVITPTLADITGSAGDGVRFTVGIGYGFSLF